MCTSAEANLSKNLLLQLQRNKNQLGSPLSFSLSVSLSLILIILNLLLADTAGTDSLFWNRNVHIWLICFNLVNLGPSYLDSTKWDKIRFERYRFTYFVCNLFHLNRGFCIFLFILLGFEASRAPFGASIMLISLHFILGFVCYCYVVDLNALQLFFFFFFNCSALDHWFFFFF